MKTKKHDDRTRVSYKACKDQKIVAKVVYQWLKTTTHVSIHARFSCLNSWREGTLFLLIDVTKLKYVNSIKRPEGDLFMKKYVAKYLGVI